MSIVIYLWHPTIAQRDEAQRAVDTHGQVVQDLVTPLKILGEYVHDPAHTDPLGHVSWCNDSSSDATTTLFVNIFS